MVVWQSDVEEKHGSRAWKLSKAELETPKFFVIPSEDVEKVFNGGTISDAKEAFRELGSDDFSSSGVKASVRTSERPNSSYELGVTRSGLKDALLKVGGSFRDRYDQTPNIVVQKMVEPGYTGALIKGDQDYVEAVEGLGVPLEEGSTVPMMFSIGDEVRARIPDQQVKVSENPVSTGFRRRSVEPDNPFDSNQLRELSQKTSESVKFVYRRGEFQIVDRFDAERFSKGLQYVQVTRRSSTGVIGEDLELSDETLPPDDYGRGLVSRKGAYISEDAKLARRDGKTAYFSYRDAEEGEKIQTASYPDETSEASGGIEQALKQEQPEIDARQVDHEALKRFLELVDREGTVLVAEPDLDLLEACIANGFRVEALNQDVESALERAERRFIIDHLRDLE